MLQPWVRHHRCGRMLIVGYSIDDLSFGMANGDFVDDDRFFAHTVNTLLLRKL